MMEDIVGDYKDKTVTLEDFPYFSNNIKMASVHPCKHASVMKTLLDRADAALKIRREKLKSGKIAPGKLFILFELSDFSGFEARKTTHVELRKGELNVSAVLAHLQIKHQACP